MDLLCAFLLFLWTLNIVYSYVFLVACFIPTKSSGASNNGPINRFVVLIPAHNEMHVIGFLLNSLFKQEYLKDAYHIIVIADNCEDDTALVCREKGVTVLERFDTEKRGKAYAIGWALEWLDTVPIPYDAVIIFDADNLVSPDFLSSANGTINLGSDAFQASVESKNPGDSFVSKANHIKYSAINRIYLTGRARLGLGALLCGTGMGFTRKLLENTGWHQSSLTEDREFTYKLLLNGVEVAWLGETFVYDEKPVAAADSFHQQSRWVSGWLMDLRKYCGPIWRELSRKRDPALLDALWVLVQPVLFVRNITFIPFLLLSSAYFLWYWWTGLFVLFLLYHAVGLWLNRAPGRYYAYLFLLPIFSLISISSALKATVSFGKVGWSHTKHTRGMMIDEINKE